MNLSNAAWWFAAWYVSGLAFGIVWPLKYRKNMRRQDWASFLKGWPFVAFAGPLAIVLTFPL